MVVIRNWRHETKPGYTLDQPPTCPEIWDHFTRGVIMMMPTHSVRILVATQPVDFRKGHDGLAALVQSALKEDPFTRNYTSPWDMTRSMTR